MDKENKIWLSPSALNIFLECPKCFWIQQVEGIHRPRGIFPSLPGGMDILIKKYFDKFRLLNKLPPEIEGKVNGQLLPNLEIINQWRNWRTGLRFEDKESGAVLFGALDDCLIDNRQYIPLDYKTRGFDVKEGGENFYKNQLNCYALLLEGNGFKTVTYAYLVYFIPKDFIEGGMTKFNIDVKKVKTDFREALKVLREAVSLIKGSMPKSHSGCEYCSWGNDFIND